MTRLVPPGAGVSDRLRVAMFIGMLQKRFYREDPKAEKLRPPIESQRAAQPHAAVNNRVLKRGISSFTFGEAAWYFSLNRRPTEGKFVHATNTQRERKGERERKQENARACDKRERDVERGS